MASMTVLYEERKETREKRLGSSRILSQLVEVQVRKWSSNYATDIVLESRVMINGNSIISDVRVLEQKEQDASYIRAGIVVFDNLLRSHPTLGKS